MPSKLTTSLVAIVLLFTQMQAQVVFAAEEPEATSPAPIHKKVQAALAWRLPVNPCEKPRELIMASTADPSQGGKAQTDIDTYTMKRYERKEKRWKKCVKKYQKTLMDDFEELKNSAQYGLTQPQADTILKKMAKLQDAYMKAEQ